MYFAFCIAACIANAIVTIVAFFLYVRARLASREQPENSTAGDHSRRLAKLARLEDRYQTIHFITLALFVLFGILILVHLSNKLNSGTIL